MSESESLSMVDWACGSSSSGMFGQRGSSNGRLEPQIFILSSFPREAPSEHLERYHVENTQYYLPYFSNPFKADETEQSTIVNIIYQMEAGLEFASELIVAQVLSRDHKDAFKEFVEEKVQEGKRANREALRKRTQAQEELRSQGKEADAFEKMRFYKFYPVATPDTPNVSYVKSTFINRYYGNAHQVF